MKKSNFRYFTRVTKDLYTIMPIEITLVLLVKFLNAILAFMQVSWTAKVMDTAGNYLTGTAFKRELFYESAVLGLCFVLPMLLDILIKPVKDLRIFLKHHMLINRLHMHVVSMPLIRFEEPEFYDDIWRAKLCVYNEGLLNYFYGFIDLIPNLLRFIGTVWVIAAYDLAFIPLAVLSVVPTFLARLIYNKNLYHLRRKQTPLERKRDYLWKVLTKKETVKELRTMQTEDYFKEQWNNARDEVLEQNYSFEKKNSNLFFGCDWFRLLGVTVSIAFSIIFVENGKISVGEFAACILAFSSLQNMAEQMVYLVTDQKQRTEFLGDFYDFFENEMDKEGEKDFPGFQKEIEVQRVSFAYPKGGEVLHDVSLSIQKGERIVIVGENGSGKTTLSKVIAGIYEPSKGEICYDGENIRQFNRGSLYRGFSVISQDFVKYSFRMRENIGISMPNQIHNDEKILKSARVANVDPIVRRIGGLDVQLGREFDGVELSGGEWQKVAIARGLHKEADIVILDEPTSALDPLVEYEILIKFLDLTSNKTAVIISHRVGLCRFADRIIVMKEGRVVGNGRHEELLQENPEYQRIWREQAKWYVKEN